MGEGCLMSMLARVESSANIAMLYPPRSLNDLRRDCKFNTRAVLFEKSVRDRVNDKARSSLGFLKYIVSMKELN